MLSLVWKEKITCQNCGTQTTKTYIVRYKKRCSVELLYCTHWPNFPTKSLNDLIYQIAKKHSAPEHDVTLKCKLFYQEFPGFFALRQHRNTQQGMHSWSGTRYVDVEHIKGDVEDHRLREELRSCLHFLVGSEHERTRNKVFNQAIGNLNAKLVDEKLDYFLTTWSAQRRWM